MVVILAGSAAFGPTNDPDVISQVIPIIMGANIGTSITSTIVSLGHIAHLSEYRKAIAAATVHDFFNIFTVHGSHINQTNRMRRLVRCGYRDPANLQISGQSAGRPGIMVHGMRARLAGQEPFSHEAVV